MASRNPSRPLPAVKNQFRPISDWVGHISDVGTCPLDAKHVMKSHKLMRHIPKCEKRKTPKTDKDEDETKVNQGLEKCPFNSLHLYPISQRENHFKECKARAGDIMARIEAGESLNDIEDRYYKQSTDKSEVSK